MKMVGGLWWNTLIETIDRRSTITVGLLEGIFVGLVCALTAMTTRSIVYLFQTISFTPEVVSEKVIPIGSVVKDQEPLSFIFIGPVIETLLFVLVAYIYKIPSSSRVKPRIYIATFGLLGWLLHGASYASLSRSIPFALLAALFVRWTNVDGRTSAFIVTATAHITWNATVLVVYWLR